MAKTLSKNFADNRKALSKYDILDKLEAGIVLTGGEVKSVRAGQISLAEAWISIDKEEMWLKKAHVNKYKFETNKEYDPIRDRKLLLHKDEIERMASKVAEKGLSLIPLRIYETRGKIKVGIGLGRGLTKYNKKRKIKDRDEQRSMERQLKRFI